MWGCHGGSNQKFQIGENDFGKFNYHMRLHSSKTFSVNNNLTGHTLISMPKYQKDNGKWHVTNTFSFWGPMFNEYRLDGQYGIHFDNVVERTNNMRNKKSNGQWTSLMVDNGGGSYDVDWNIGKANPADAGGEFGGYRRTTFGLPKVVFEQIKYMNGYKVDDYINTFWLPTCQTCASYSVRLWNSNTNDSRFGGGCWTPGAIYNVL
jgi:hypothetical protein